MSFTYYNKDVTKDYLEKLLGTEELDMIITDAERLHKLYGCCQIPYSNGIIVHINM